MEYRLEDYLSKQSIVTTKKKKQTTSYYYLKRSLQGNILALEQRLDTESSGDPNTSNFSPV